MLNINYRPENLTTNISIALIFVGLTSSAACAYEFKVSSLYGVDSNPYHLTDSFNPLEDNFLYFDMRYRQNYQKNLVFTADLKSASYSQDSNADWSRAKVDLKFRSKFGSKKNRVSYRIFGNYNKTDSTYISKFTGVEAAFAGVSLGDRYDADIFNIGTIFSIKTDNKTKLDFGFSHREKQYESYNLVGLSNLDYSHNSLRLGARIPITEMSNFTLNTNYTVRDYDDRRAKDVVGADITSTDLVFNVLDIKGTYSYNTSKSNSIKITFKYGKRTDNGAGFWDSSSNYVSVYTKQNLTDKHQISAKLKYSLFNYDNRTDVNENLDELTKENKGLSLDIDYLWLISVEEKSNLLAYMKLSMASFDSSTVEYEFQSNELSLGIKYEFD